MKQQTSYKYCILRYVHDVRTQEFLNVGVLFHAKEAAVLKFRGIEKTGRLSGAFPGIDPQLVLHSIERFQKTFAELVRSDGAAMRTPLELFCKAVLPNDDSSFQWASAGGGICDDSQSAFASVFQRYVGRYERRNAKRVRSDADVWDVLSVELGRRKVLGHLHSTKIKTSLRSYSFQHAWKNHQIHALKPFSLDGTNGDDIADKASHWAGAMRDLARSPQQFQLHLVVGHPQQPHLRDSFASALGLLRDCADGTRTLVHDEQEIPDLAQRIAEDLAVEGNSTQ